MNPPFISSCSSIGPSANTGKNVKAPTTSTTITSKITKSTLVLGNAADVIGTFPFLAKAPAIARAGIITANLPISMPNPKREVVKYGVGT